MADTSEAIRRVGRPSKLTPEIQRAICESIALSIPNKYAAEEAGIDEDTFASWMRKGREGHATYEGFYRAVTRARASAVKSLTIRVLGGGKGSSGSAWLLERRFANDYGPRQRLELSEDPERPLGNVRAALDGMSIDQIRKLAE